MDSDEFSDTEEEIMEATFRALCKHGYVNLSIASIAEEFDKSKSLLYYHYDSKDDLLAAFLEFAIDYFLADLEAQTGENPLESLHELVDAVLLLEIAEEVADAQRALTELRMKAVADETFRQRMTASDERLANHIHGLLAEAAEEGLIHEADREQTAEHLHATLMGGMLTRSSTDRDDSTAAVRESLHAYLDGLRVDREDE